MVSHVYPPPVSARAGKVIESQPVERPADAWPDAELFETPRPSETPRPPSVPLAPITQPATRTGISPLSAGRSATAERAIAGVEQLASTCFSMNAVSSVRNVTRVLQYRITRGPTAEYHPRGGA